MLSVYTRHYPPCPRNDIHYRRCHYPKWIQGTLEHRHYFRVSGHTRSWKTAEQKAREMERLDLEANKPQPVTIKTAIRAFVADHVARRLLPQSINKSRLLLEAEFGAWCEKRSLETLQQLGPVEMRDFRYVWNSSPKSAYRKHERMRSFFVFCISNGWLQNNPMNVLKKPRIPDVIPTNYFTRTDFQTIVNATQRYDYGGGNDCHHRGERLRALVLLMRWRFARIQTQPNLYS